MGMLYFFRHRPVPSAILARERLRIVVAQARSNRSAPDYLDAMRSELLAVIKKYTSFNFNDTDDDDDFDGSLAAPPNPSPRSAGGASASVKPAQPAH